MPSPYLPFLEGKGCAQFFTDPVFCSYLAAPPQEDLASAAMLMLSTFPNLALDLGDLEWLRGLTELPLLVKGVLTAEDALEARKRGVDGVVVVRTTAGVRSTGPWPRSTRSSRFATRSAPTPPF